jgi:hypothetical protein
VSENVDDAKEILGIAFSFDAWMSYQTVECDSASIESSLLCMLMKIEHAQNSPETVSNAPLFATV